jgi:hypothetical protein
VVERPIAFSVKEVSGAVFRLRAMKTSILGFAFIASLATSHIDAAIITGPISNPANGHDYYLLSADSWTASEAEAERLGGTLAVIRNAAEQGWVFSKFANFGGTNRDLWIGLSRSGAHRELNWVTGEKPDYELWAGGQPDDGWGVEGFVFMASNDKPWGFAAGRWGDVADNALIDWRLPNGVVEVPGKSNEKALTSKEKALIGKWYYAGKEENICRIAGTENELFVINESSLAGRAVMTPEGSLYIASSRLRGEILKERILWSNGTWWSRDPLLNKTSKLAITTEDVEKAKGPQVDVPLIY